MLADRDTAAKVRVLATWHCNGRFAWRDCAVEPLKERPSGGGDIPPAQVIYPGTSVIAPGLSVQVPL